MLSRCRGRPVDRGQELQCQFGVDRNLSSSFDAVCFEDSRYLNEAPHHGAEEVKKYLLVFQHEAVHADRAIRLELSL